MKVVHLLAPALICALCACTQDKPPPPKAAVQTPPAAPAPTVLDDQMRALQKARDVQKTMDQRAPDVDQKLKDAGG
jgi:hypothetical protein